MRTRVFGAAVAAVASGLFVAALGSPASAGSVTVADSYYGGLNTYNSNFPTSGDVIGDSTFQIYGATATRTGNNLTVEIYTNFVQNLPAEYGVGLGALFLGNGTPNYNVTSYNQSTHVYTNTGPGSASNDFASDTYVVDPGRFQFAATIPNPTNPGTSGTGTFYSLATGTHAGSDVTLSNVNNVSITYPYTGNNGFYFRDGQAVGVNPNQYTTTDSNAVNWSIGSGTWNSNPTGTLTFTIANAFNYLTDNFTLAWEMTCANDIIVATIDLPGNAPPPGGTPLPAAFPMFAGGLGMLGYLARRRKAKQL